MGRGLLVLAGEIIFADRAADMLEHGARLALRVQCLAALAGEMLRPEERVDQLALVVLGVGEHLVRRGRQQQHPEIVRVVEELMRQLSRRGIIDARTDGSIVVRPPAEPSFVQTSRSED